MLAITTVLLFVVFIAAEFYRFRRRITGAVREVCPFAMDPTGLMGAQLRVTTVDAGEITAFVSGCQMCVSRVEVGDTVSLIPGPNGYVVGSCWIDRQRHGVCARRVAP